MQGIPKCIDQWFKVKLLFFLNLRFFLKAAIEEDNCFYYQLLVYTFQNGISAIVNKSYKAIFYRDPQMGIRNVFYVAASKLWIDTSIPERSFST